MKSPDPVHRTFPPLERSIGEARRFVRVTLDPWDLGEVVDLAVLAVSELVTNVVMHAGTAAEVCLLVGRSLRVEVTDSHAGRSLPLVWGPPPEEAEGGRGLLIASTLAPRWGVSYTRTTKTVWLDFPLGVETAQDGAGTAVTDGASSTVRGEETAAHERGGGPGGRGVAGLSDDALDRLGVDDYLTLAVERARDAVGADAAYLLLASGFGRDFEVRAVSGLDAALVGVRVEPHGPGMPEPRNPHLPILVPDLDLTPVRVLRSTSLRSLIVAPVMVGGVAAGVLVAGSEVREGFTEAEASVLQRTADVIGPGVERARLGTAERDRRGWLTFIAEAGDLLAGSLDQRMTMAVTAQLLVPQLSHWCAIYLDDDRQRLCLEHVWHEDERFNEPMRGLLQAWDPDEGGELPPADAVPQLDPGEPAVLPLVARGRRIGVVVIGRDRGQPLGGELFLVTESLARRAALAIDNARAHGELRHVGSALQESLLPSSLPHIDGLDIGVVYEAAGESSEVGGDFYDVIALDSGAWLFVVGDVCGKGAQAAAVTGLARHTIRALARVGLPVGAILERLNTAILEEGQRARFLTLACGLLRPSTSGNLLMSLVCAGHPAPFLVGGDGQVRQMGRPQTMLGVLKAPVYTAEELVLERGDLLVTVTDGVLERRDGSRMLGEEGLMALLTNAGELGAQAVAERVRRAVLEFAAEPQQDDMAVLALRSRA